MYYGDDWYRFNSQFKETHYEKQERLRKRRLKEKEEKEKEATEIVDSTRSRD